MRLVTQCSNSEGEKMQFSGRFLAASSLLLAIAGCKWELVDTNYAVEEATSFTLERHLSTDSFSGSLMGDEYNPLSCVSLPADWTHEVDAEFTSNLAEPPVLELTLQASAALALEESFSREGFDWTCYSAFPTAETMGDVAQGTVTFTITPHNVSAPVQIFSTLGLQVNQTMSALALHDVFPGTIPAGEPVRLDDEAPLVSPLDGLEGPQNWDITSTSFNGKLLVNNLTGLPMTTFSFDGDAVVTGTEFPFPVDAFSEPVVIDGELVFPISTEGGIVMVTTVDGEVWSPVGTGIEASESTEIIALSFDQEMNRWELIVREAELLNAYFLSNSDDEGRFLVIGSESGMETPASGIVRGKIKAADGKSLVLLHDNDVLSLLEVGEADWSVTPLLNGAVVPSSMPTLVMGDTLYLAIGGDVEANGFYQYSLSGGGGLQWVSSLPLEMTYSLAAFDGGLLLTTTDSLLVSIDDGASWEQLLNDSMAVLVTAGWSLTSVDIQALTGREALVNISAWNGVSDVPFLSAMVKVDLESGNATFMGGSGMEPSISSPETPDTSWRYLGKVGDVHYRWTFNLNKEVVLERFSLKASVSGASGSETPASRGSSGGGGLPGIFLFALVLIGWLRLRQP
ncbi:MAG: hypothetical protein ACPH3N_05875 [Alcanivorax sediminis]